MCNNIFDGLLMILIMKSYFLSRNGYKELIYHDAAQRSKKYCCFAILCWRANRLVMPGAHSQRSASLHLRGAEKCQSVGGSGGGGVGGGGPKRSSESQNSSTLGDNR